jgi:hypothetical protein
MTIIRVLIALFAILLMVGGAVVTISPIPGGFIIVIVGFLLFASVAPATVRGIRKRWKWFDRQIHRAEKHLPKWLARLLRESDYVHPDEKEDEEARAQTRRTSALGRS